MDPSPTEIAARAISHDAVLALEALLADGLDPIIATAGALAVWVFVRVLNCDFDGALDLLPRVDGQLAVPLSEFVGAICLARIPAVPEDQFFDHDEDQGLVAFLQLEAAMSGGQIARAEQLAMRLAPKLRDLGDGVYWAWNQVALARSLAFQSRFTEARQVVDAVLNDVRRANWLAVDRIALGTQAFVAAHQGDSSFATTFSARVRAEIPTPRTYRSRPPSCLQRSPSRQRAEPMSPPLCSSTVAAGSSCPGCRSSTASTATKSSSRPSWLMGTWRLG